MGICSKVREKIIVTEFIKALTVFFCIYKVSEYDMAASEIKLDLINNKNVIIKLY